MVGPLEGIKVLDFGMEGVGPWAASLLGFLGANVVKVERPQGDTQWGQQPFQNGFPIGYTCWNMSKRSIVLDLKVPSGRAALKPLVQEADVVMANLRPGKMANIGMGYEVVKALNPRIIYGSCPGWGNQGPMADLPFADPQSQAFSGFASLNGDPGGKPELFRHSYHLDLVTATFFTSTILLGLLSRERTGRGQEVGCSHLASSINVHISRMAEYWTTGQVPGPLGSASGSTAPHQVFLCQDKRYLAVGVETQEQWQGLCKALGQPDLLEDPRFTTNVDRVEHRDALAQVLQGCFIAKPARWWAIQLERNSVPYGYPYDFETLRNHAQVLENRLIEYMDIPHQGMVYVGGVPWRFSESPATLYAAPRPGQHTEEVLSLGWKAFGNHAEGPPGERKGLEAIAYGQRPLAGLKVVEVAQGLCGPYTGLLLAEAGAHVIKVEPPSGDYSRQFAPRGKDGASSVFRLLNRNKEGKVMDLATEEGRRALHSLLGDADIFIEDWGPGKAEEMGLGYEDLRRSNPRLVYCAISPFGEKGPFAQRPGSELVVQAMAEYWASLGEVGGPPLRVGADVANLSTSVMAFLGTLAALFHRARRGRGQRVAVSMLGTLLTYREAAWSVLSGPDTWDGTFTSAYTSPRNHGFLVGDRRLYLAMGQRTDWVALLRDLGLEKDAEAIAEGLQAHRGALHYVLKDEVFKSRSYDEVLNIFRRHDANAVPLNGLKDVLEHPQTAVLDIVDTLEDPQAGPMKALRPPWTGPWPRASLTPAPELPRA
ncbi:MAG: CoA transferase [Chloroflexi bacterium]|nr:CoA transferase [Chloroflexota bacterium]